MSSDLHFDIELYFWGTHECRLHVLHVHAYELTNKKIWDFLAFVGIWVSIFEVNILTIFLWCVFSYNSIRNQNSITYYVLLQNDKWNVFKNSDFSEIQWAQKKSLHHLNQENIIYTKVMFKVIYCKN